MHNERCTKCNAPLRSVANGTMKRCVKCDAMYIVGELGASEVHEDYARSELAIGDSFLFAKNWDEATKCFKRLCKQYPLEMDSWLGLARSLTREQNYLDMSYKDYRLLLKCLSKVQTLSGALLDDSWQSYKQRYQQHCGTKRVALQKECDELAHWVDENQGGYQRMILQMVYLIFALFFVVGGFVVVMIDLKFWYIMLLCWGIASLLVLIMRWSGKKMRLEKDDIEYVRQQRDYLQKSAEYYHVELTFRSDIRALK